jgi:antitoxin component of MazEF toxin-antitoxin module
MDPVVTNIRKYGGTLYARIPPELAERYALKDGDAIGLELHKVLTEPLEPTAQEAVAEPESSKNQQDDF